MRKLEQASSPFRYLRQTFGLAVLLAPFIQGCSDDFPCAATATCRAPRADDGGAELDATSDALRSSDATSDIDGGVTTANDGGAPSRDGALDTSSDGDGSGTDDAHRDRH